jgi:dTDP-4-amino-4,6-dideoxygalactose transaminase
MLTARVGGPRRWHLGVIGPQFSAKQGADLRGGGALVTDDPELAARIYSLKNCGRPWKSDLAPGFGGNYRSRNFRLRSYWPN